MLPIKCIFCSKPLIIENNVIKCEEHFHEMAGYLDEDQISTFSIKVNNYYLHFSYNKFPRTMISKSDLSGSNYQVIFSKPIETALPQSYDAAIKKINVILTYM